MTPRSFWLVLLVSSSFAAGGEPADNVPANPAIDMPGFLRIAEAAARHRESHRVGQEQFIRMSREAGTIVLDARSSEKYAELHVKGAIHIAFPDFTVQGLARLIPDKNTRILIYCNNNFTGAEQPFPEKRATASLNLSTFIALYDYGYRNVYELAPLVALADSKLTFEGTLSGDTMRAGR